LLLRPLCLLSPLLHSPPASAHLRHYHVDPVQARSLVSGQLVATKQINIEQHEADLESIRLEIRILNDCRHPNVVQYLASYVFDDTLWINLE
jgi:serine/threonine protein kinase